ncbi:hypothetical protein PsorP6_017361 [Peronosclerospora sorghi]|uniref:Uncharacterized protein n=1 Tax=Peronosclerospora sorghi TaxID=230839 RepID=A0ACC0WL61_9STRA|nr:hypothetical protein PsorP6_017361 [Peronosclerospora sorghi]
MKAVPWISRYGFALVAASVLCFSRRTCDSARAMRTVGQADQVDAKALKTVDDPNESRVFRFSATEAATIKRAAENLNIESDSLQSTGVAAKAAKLLSRDDSFKSTVTSETAHDWFTRHDPLEQGATSQSMKTRQFDSNKKAADKGKKLLSRDDNFKSTVTSESADDLWTRHGTLKQVATSQSTKRRQGHDMEVDSNKKAKLLESLEKYLTKQIWFNEGADSRSNTKRKGNDIELSGKKKSKLLESIEGNLNKLRLQHEGRGTARSNKKRKDSALEVDSVKRGKLLHSLENLDEDTMLLMIVGAKQHQVTGLKPRELETYLLEKWEDYGLTLDEVLDRTSDATMLELLKYPMPEIWLTYADKVKQDPYEVLLERLTLSYGEANLARKLMTLKVHRTSDEPVASQLVKLLLENWLERGLDFNGVSNRLGLKRNDLFAFLRDPATNMCFLYAKWQRQDPYASFLSWLNEYVGDQGIASILVVAKEGGENVKFIEQLQLYQFSHWRVAGMDQNAAKVHLGLTDWRAGREDEPLYQAWKLYGRYLKIWAKKE